MAQKVSLPYVNAPLVPESPPASVAPKLTTIIGQMLPAGTATAGVLTENINVFQANTLFGAGSMLATMINNFAKINQVSEVDVVALDDNGAAVDATGTIVFAGTVNIAGTFVFNIGSSDRVYTIDITTASTLTTIGDALEAAITADVNALVTASNAAGTVTLTAKNGGTIGNAIGMQVSGSAGTVTVALTAMASGATDPVMTGIADLLVKRTDIVMPYEYGIDTFVTLEDNRFNTNNDILDGRIFTALSDTAANIETVGDAENSQSLVLFGDKPVDTAIKKGTAIFEMLYDISSQFAAVRALRLESDPPQAITDVVVTTAVSDQKSGPHTNSLPYHNTPLSLPVIPTGQGWTTAEVTTLNGAGVSVVGNNLAANLIICGDILTTYKTNIQGVADISYKYLNYVDTSTVSREFIFNSLKSDYAQKRLTNGVAVPGYAFADRNDVRADMKSYYLTLSGAGYVLLQTGALTNGKDVVDVFMDELIVTLDVRTGNIDISAILPINTQVRSIFVPLKIVFNPQEL